MSDIVERARAYARNCGGPPEEYLTWQLADEIERLKAALRNALTAWQEGRDINEREILAALERK